MRFRKRPVEIEAEQFDGTKDSANRILAWIGGNGKDATRVHPTRPDQGLTIVTLEGPMTARPGWWVIQGVAGEFYPCDPDIFTATYEPVEQ